VYGILCVRVAVPPHLLNNANRMNISREHGARIPLPTGRGLNCYLWLSLFSINLTNFAVLCGC